MAYDSELHAMVAWVIEDERGLENVETAPDSIRIVDSLYHSLSLKEVFIRVSHSEHSTALCLHLARKLSAKKTSSALWTFLNALPEFETATDCDMEDVADVLWQTIITERLNTKDFRRAWDEIKSAFRGLHAPEYEAGLPPVQGQYPAKDDTIQSAISTLFGKMLEAGMVQPLMQEQLTVPLAWRQYNPVPAVAGWPWAVAVDLLGTGNPFGIPAPYCLGPEGQKVLAIVGALNAIRAKKPSRKKR